MDNQRLAQFRTPEGRKRLIAGGALLAIVVGGTLVALLHRSPEPRAAAPQRRAASAAARGSSPETIADEKLRLSAGQFKAYPMHLAAQRNVSVRVDASPVSPVNVALVQKVRFERFRADRDALFADKSQLVEALSGQRVVKGSPHARVPAGDWVLVVERPKGSPDSKGEAGVTLRVTSASIAGQ